MSDAACLQWKCLDRYLDVEERPLIMGIVNVTPDSFSDGGEHYRKDDAVQAGLRMLEAGADILDIGGESSRPGAQAVGEEEELARVIPVIKALSRDADAIFSVDTMKAGVARQAVEAGARVINDVSALTQDPEMLTVVKETGAGVVLMHMQGTPRTMQKNPRYENVVRDVAHYLQVRVDDLTANGVARDTLVVDPGIGFGKTVAHNLELLANLNVIGECGRPVLVGLSRKSLLGQLTGRPVNERVAAGIAALTYCVLSGAHIMRVHDVKESLDAVKVAMALKRKHSRVE